MTKQSNIEIVTAVFAVGESRLFSVAGNYFEIIQASGAVNVVLSDLTGAQNGRMIGAGASFYSKDTPFSTIQITSATAQTVRFAYGTGETGTRATSGSVTVTNNGGAFTQAAAAVGAASGPLLGENTLRRYLMIQNKSATQDIFVTLNGVAATTALGLHILPGGSLELDKFCPTGSINAIASAAGATCVIVEG